jgi:hypothetical protein
MSHHHQTAATLWPTFEGGSSPPTQQLALFEPPSCPSCASPAGSQSAEAHAVWSEADVVMLHWGLLEDLRKLQDPETPLDEKIETLNWVFTDSDKDTCPFSFVSCLKVVGCSPLSPVDGYFGLVDHEAVRDWIAANVSRWMRATIERYPAWVRELIRSDPQHVAHELLRNPQWLNEEVKRRSAPDLLDTVNRVNAPSLAGEEQCATTQMEVCGG